jgi:transposase-like protein
MSRRRKSADRGGRPSKFTTDTAVALAAALGRGESVEAAAQAASVGVSTAYRWVARGRSGDPAFTVLAALAETARKRRLRSPSKGLSFPFWKACFES